MTDQFFIIPGLGLLNMVASVGGIWFYANLSAVFRDFDWYTSRLGLNWFAQIALLGACIVTYMMTVWYLGGYAVALWFILICPPLVFLVLGLIVPVVLLSLWLAVFAVAVAWAKTRVFAPTLATVPVLILAPAIFDTHWDAQMCQSAQEHGLKDIQRARFLINVARIASKSPREPYAIAYDGEAYWDWSYSGMRFVRFQTAFPHSSDTSNFTSLVCE